MLDLGPWVTLWNYETIRQSLMKPKWQKLASLARKYAHSSFSSLVKSLLPKDTLLRTYLTSLQLVAVERLPALRYSVDLFFLSFGIIGYIVELRNY